MVTLCHCLSVRFEGFTETVKLFRFFPNWCSAGLAPNARRGT